MKKTNKKGLLKRIKWENITFIIMLLLGIASMQHHYTLNGLYKGLLLELSIYLMFSFVFRYIVKDIRKNPSNWTF